MKRTRTLLLAALLLYAGCYLALVRRGSIFDMHRPEYAACDAACRLAFAPAQWLDRTWFRPLYWATPASIY